MMPKLKRAQPGLYLYGRFLIVQREWGDWSVYEGSISDYWGDDAAWWETFPRLKDAKAWIESVYLEER